MEATAIRVDDQAADPRALVDAAMSELPPREWAVVRRRYWQQWRWSEIAHVMGTTSAEAQRVHDVALERLRGTLGAMGVERVFGMGRGAS